MWCYWYYCSSQMYFSCSVIVPFGGDYVGLRRNPLWKAMLKRNRLHRMDQRIVLADIVNKINRSNGKVVFLLRHGFVGNE